MASLGTGQEAKHAMAFIQGMKRDLVQRQPGTSMESILDRTLIFDEFEILDVAIP